MQYAVHIAPMMGYTHRHFRYLMRRLCPQVLLYSEMITTGALLHGQAHRYLAYDVSELPLVLQLGGNDPAALAQCAQMAVERGYSEINLNVGCPSARVREGGIGASLYSDAGLVADCVAAMRAAVDVPVTVKCRIGVDDCDGFDYLQHFAERVHAAGSDYLVVHARKAWLHGLNPKQNRTVPPLRYDVVKRLAHACTMPIVLNGGLTSQAAMREQLALYPAVMVGRYACAYPLAIAEFSRGEALSLEALQVVLADYLAYMDSRFALGDRVSFMLQPLHGFFRASAGAKQWRHVLAAMQTSLLAKQGVPSDYLPQVQAQMQHCMALLDV